MTALYSNAMELTGRSLPGLPSLPISHHFWNWRRGAGGEVALIFPSMASNTPPNAAQNPAENARNPSKSCQVQSPKFSKIKPLVAADHRLATTQRLQALASEMQTTARECKPLTTCFSCPACAPPVPSAPHAALVHGSVTSAPFPRF
jgi:hypothetical protein